MWGVIGYDATNVGSFAPKKLTCWPGICIKKNGWTAIRAKRLGVDIRVIAGSSAIRLELERQQERILHFEFGQQKERRLLPWPTMLEKATKSIP